VLGGTPLPLPRSIGIKILGRISRQNLVPLGLRGKILSAWDLALLPASISALGLPRELPAGVGPPVHPGRKVKLDKSEAGRAVLFLHHDFLGYDVDGHTSTC